MTMKFYAIRAFFWLFLSTGAYYAWSRAFRWAFQRDMTHMPIELVPTLAKLEGRLKTMKYRSDHFWSAFDVIDEPAVVERRWQNGKPVGDCDEFAVYAARQLEAMTEGLNPDLINDVRFVTVNWLDAKGKFSGHNICTFMTRSDGRVRYGHIGNWFKGQAQFEGVIAEGPRKPFRSVEDIVQWFAECQYLRDESRRGGRLIGWSSVGASLRGPKETHLGA